MPSLETGLLPQGGDVNLEDIVKQEEIERNEAEEDSEQDSKEETQELIEHDKEFQDNISEEEDIDVKNGKIRNSKSITTTPVLSEQQTRKKKHKMKRDEEIRSLELSGKSLEPRDDDEFTSLFLKKRRQKVTAACDEEGLFVHNSTFTWPFHTAAIGVSITV